MNVINKLSKVRTYAQDAQNVQQAEATAKANASKVLETKVAAKKPIPPAPAAPKTAVSAIPVKPIPAPKQTDEHVNQLKKEEVQAAEQQPDANIPPFHTLQDQSTATSAIPPKKDTIIPKQKADAISESAKQISDQPKSILEATTTSTIEQEDGVESATIISDTKHNRKTILQSIGESTKRWFVNFKNTYITPPKPTYTVTRSERRTDVLTDATARTGTANVAYDDFAARLRARFVAEEEGENTKTDSAFLPELPPKDPTQTEIVEVEKVPKETNSASETAAVEKPSLTAIPKKQTSDKDEIFVAAITKNRDTEVASIFNSAAPETKDYDQSEVSMSRESDKTSNGFTVATNTPDTEKPLPATTPHKDIKQTLAETTLTSTISPHLEKDTDAARDTDAPNQTPSNGQTNITAENEPEQDTAILPDVEYETIPQEKAIKAATQPEDQTSSSTEQIDEFEVFRKPRMNQIDTAVDERKRQLIASGNVIDQKTNLLSVKVVVVFLAALITGYVLILVVPVWLNDESEISTVAVDQNTQTLVIAQYPDAASRFNAITNKIAERTETESILLIEPVTLQDGEWKNAQPTTVFNAFNLTVPLSLQDVTTRITFGGHTNAHPFILLRVSDRSTARGGLLRWETAMPADLATFFSAPVGVFRDEIHQDTDLRVLQTDSGLTLTYGLFDNNVIITTSPEAWTSISQQLRR